MPAPAPLPANVSFGTVTGRFIVAEQLDLSATDPDATPAKGTVTFTPSVASLRNVTATPKSVIVPKPIVVALDKDGALEARLIATDDTDLNPVGWTYTVSFAFTNVANPANFSISVPVGSRQDLADLAPVASARGTFYVVPPIAIEALAASETSRLAALAAAADAGSAASAAAASSSAASSSASSAAASAALVGAPAKAAMDAALGGDVAGLVPTVTGKVDKGSLFVNVKDYGAKGDYIADDTAAINAALSAARSAPGGAAVVFFPAGTYKVSSSLAPASNTVLRGAGHASWIRGSGTVTTPTITLSGVSRVTLEDLRISGSGGHAIAALDVYYFNVNRCSLIQYAVGKSVIYHQGNGNFIDVQVTNSIIDTVAGNTVPAVYLENGANKLAATRWQGLRLNGANVTAAPFFRMRNTGAGNWTHDHSFRDITAELCDGGVFYGSSVFGATFEGVIPWDVATYTEHIFFFDKEPTSAESRSIAIRGSGRRGGAMAAGKSDVYFSSGCQDVIVENCRPSTGTIVVTLPTSYGVVRTSGEGRTERHSYGGSVKLPYPSTVDRPSAASAGVGTVVYDFTLKKPIYSDGTAWRDAMGTIV